MLPRNYPDRIQITFDDRRLVANAGLLLPATLARHLGLPELVRQRLDLGDAPGRANTSDRMMTLVASALAGGDCIDDADVLRTGGRPAPWTWWWMASWAVRWTLPLPVAGRTDPEGQGGRQDRQRQRGGGDGGQWRGQAGDHRDGRGYQ